MHNSAPWLWRNSAERRFGNHALRQISAEGSHGYKHFIEPKEVAVTERRRRRSRGAGEFQEAPVFTPSDKGGRLLDVQFEYSRQLWPWSGYLALFIRVGKGGAQFEGPASGKVSPHA